MRLGGFEPPTRGLEVDAGEVAAPREDWAGRMVGWQRLGRARTICGPVVDPTLTLPADARLGCMLELLTCLQGQKRSERRPALRDRRRNAHERKSLFAATPWAQRLGGAEEIAGRIVDERVDGGRAARRLRQVAVRAGEDALLGAPVARERVPEGRLAVLADRQRLQAVVAALVV